MLIVLQLLVACSDDDALPPDAGADAGPARESGAGELGLDAAGDAAPVQDQAAVDADAGPLKCQVQHELPIVTHWSNATKGYQYLASDQVKVDVPYPASATYQAGTCYPVWQLGGKTFYPDLDSYVAMTFSDTKVSDSAAVALANDVCTKTGVPLRWLRPDALPGATTPGRLKDKPGHVQAIHGLVIRADSADPGGLATIFLPANWSSAAKEGTYPIVANGYYDLNVNVFVTAVGEHLGRWTAWSATNGGGGAIAVQYNGMGPYNFTLNKRAYLQFGALIDLVAKKLGGDRDRIVMFGGSRGGITALNMASNPYKLSYKVKYISVGAAAAKYGTIVRLGSTVTYPQLVTRLTRVIGLHDCWRTGWTYPSCGPRTHLHGKTITEAGLYIVTGSASPSYVDANLSAFSDAHVAGLKAAGTQVHLDIGTLDKLPFTNQLAYGLKLQQQGVPVHVDLVARAGHSGRQGYIDLAWKALQVYLFGGGTPTVTPGISYYAVNRSTEKIEPAPAGTTAMPFTFEGPSGAAHGMSFPLVFTGVPGTKYELTIKPPAGSSAAPLTFAGAIPAGDPTAISHEQSYTVPATMATGAWTYALKILKPGAAGWQVIPSTNTPAGPGKTAVLNITKSLPNISGDEFFDLLNKTRPELKTYASRTSWGLSEY